MSDEGPAAPKFKALDIGIIIPELRKHGGAERLLIECLARWQHQYELTVYATVFNDALLAEAGLTRLKTKQLSPYFEGEHATLLNATVLPKIWEVEIGRHDVYHAHLWPTHLVDLHPMVWYPHEPLRLLYDLRYAQSSDEDVGEAQKRLHFYPKETYDSVEGRYYRALMRAIEVIDLTGRPDRIVANSRYTASYLSQVYKLPVDDVVYPGVTIGDMIHLPCERNMVLTIGQLWPNKRMRIVIEAIAEVEGVQLYIAGSGPEQEYLERLAQRMGVDDRVFFLPGLDNHEVQILLARCLCVVFAPVREPFGIVALEALAAGKPLIAVNEGGYVEVIDESCAVLVPPEPLALAREIRRFHADPAFAERLGRQGREVARQYSWDRTARELGAIIEQAHRQWVIQHRPVKNSSGPLFAAHYFSWYREGFGSAHWCDDPATGWVTDVPELGYYSSINGDTLATHLDQVERTGVDALIFNLHVSDDGIDLFQLAAMQRMMAIAKERGSSLRFAVNFCLYTQDIENIRQAVRILETSVLNQDSYLCVDSKRIFMIFWTGTFDHNIALIEQLRILLSGYLRIGSYMRPIDASSEARRTLGLFHAISPFSPLELGSSGTWEEVWRREYDSSSQASGYRCLTICPGYDDSHLLDQARRRGVRTIPHGDGATYRRMMDFALAQSAPHFVFITSFNEFHENTHIEPSRNHGSKYLDMTRDFIGDARARWGGGNLAVEGKIARPEGVNCEN